MTFISRGEVYEDYPMGADCDLDALTEWRLRVIEQATNLAVDFCMALVHQLTGLPPLNFDFLHELPAAAGLGGAGSPVPVSSPAPGTPNETRN